MCYEKPTAVVRALSDNRVAGCCLVVFHSEHSYEPFTEVNPAASKSSPVSINYILVAQSCWNQIPGTVTISVSTKLVVHRQAIRLDFLREPVTPVVFLVVDFEYH